MKIFLPAKNILIESWHKLYGYKLSFWILNIAVILFNILVAGVIGIIEYIVTFSYFHIDYFPTSDLSTWGIFTNLVYLSRHIVIFLGTLVLFWSAVSWFIKNECKAEEIIKIVFNKDIFLRLTGLAIILLLLNMIFFHLIIYFSVLIFTYDPGSAYYLSSSFVLGMVVAVLFVLLYQAFIRIFICSPLIILERNLSLMDAIRRAHIMVKGNSFKIMWILLTAYFIWFLIDGILLWLVLHLMGDVMFLLFTLFIFAALTFWLIPWIYLIEADIFSRLYFPPYIENQNDANDSDDDGDSSNDVNDKQNSTNHQNNNEEK